MSQQWDVPDNHGQRGPPEAPKKTKPLWQNTGEDTGEAHGTGRVASMTALPSPPKSRVKSTIRFPAQSEPSGGGRQKLMMVLIPVLAIALVVALKHPLSARSTAKAASARSSEAAPAAVAEAPIAWEVPSPYDLRSRDLMRARPTPPVAVESVGTTVQPTDPPVDLVVTGILLSEDKPAAVVDTQIVHEGQQISGATVEKIEKDGIHFERNGRKWKQAINK